MRPIAWSGVLQIQQGRDGKGDADPFVHFPFFLDKMCN
jgi:hypothetical protein